MTIEEAGKLLNMVKDGAPIPGDVLNEALFMCGERNSSHDKPDPEIDEFVDAMRQSGLL